MEINKDCTTYFMTKMTQKEWNEIRKDRSIVRYEFNKIRKCDAVDQCQRRIAER